MDRGVDFTSYGIVTLVLRKIGGFCNHRRMRPAGGAIYRVQCLYYPSIIDRSTRGPRALCESSSSFGVAASRSLQSPLNLYRGITYQLITMVREKEICLISNKLVK